MKLKSMSASFGGLNKARLELGEGLNLISAPNEAGKSTWCAFLKAMLYGIDTRDRDKKNYLADKNRYQPWSGAPMEGEIQLEWQGREITLRRGPRGNTPFGSFSAVYTNSGEAVSELSAANCGVSLLATIHAADREELLHKPLFAELLTMQVFRRLVTITVEGGSRVYRTEAL